MDIIVSWCGLSVDCIRVNCFTFSNSWLYTFIHYILITGDYFVRTVPVVIPTIFGMYPV